jgi:hypothetical protein
MLAARILITEDQRQEPHPAPGRIDPRLCELPSLAAPGSPHLGVRGQIEDLRSNTLPVPDPYGPRKRALAPLRRSTDVVRHERGARRKRLGTCHSRALRTDTRDKHDTSASDRCGCFIPFQPVGDGDPRGQPPLTRQPDAW